jgi:hypothetical protein
MIRNVEARLRKLEAEKAPPAAFTQWHRVIGCSEEECEAQRRGMIGSGQAEEANNFIFRVLVTPLRFGTLCVAVEESCGDTSRRIPLSRGIGVQI